MLRRKLQESEIETERQEKVFLDSISMKERPAAEQERTLLRMQGHTITLRTSRTRSMQETFRRFLYVTERRG